MTKIRVHEYAKQVNRTSKEVIDELGKINVSVTNHMSTLDNDSITKLNSKFSGNVNKQSAPKVETKGAEQKMTPKPITRFDRRQSPSTRLNRR